MNQTHQHGTASSSAAAAVKFEHGAAGVKRSADAMSGVSGAPIQYAIVSLDYTTE